MLKNEIPTKNTGTWKTFNYAIDIPKLKSTNDKMKIYIWNIKKQSFYIDNSNAIVKKAGRAYYATYFTEPGDYYYQGIDIALYYLNALKLYGPDFYKTLDQHKAKGLIMDFNFFKELFY